MSEPEKLLPLHAWHRSHGARMVPFAGYAMPVQYEGIIAEHRWTRSAVSLFDVSHMGQLIIAGRDVESSLESVLPSDLLALREGKVIYSVLLNDDGGIIDDLLVTRRGDHFYLVVNGATKQSDIEYLEQRLRGLVVDHMREQALLALQGPHAAEALAPLAADALSLGFMEAGAFKIGSVLGWISRTGYTGEDGFEISVPASSAVEIADLLLGQPQVRPAGLGARDSLRLEAGLPLYGHDIDYRTSPIQAGLGFAIAPRRRANGGFAGDERIRRELGDGPPLRRVGIAVSGRQPVREGSSVVAAGGAEIGWVTSGGFSPTLEAPIAMAYVPSELAAPGSALRLSQRGKMFDGEVVRLPFVPHRYHRKES